MTKLEYDKLSRKAAQIIDQEIASPSKRQTIKKKLAMQCFRIFLKNYKKKLGVK